MVLTVLTVAVSHAGLPSPWNLVVALVIAAIKPTLVCAFFMHLAYDKLLHSIALIGAVLFFLLFVGFTVMDTGHYQQDLTWDPDNPPRSKTACDRRETVRCR